MKPIQVLSKVYGMKYSEIAKKIPCDCSYITLWNNGTRKMSDFYIERISNIFEVEKEYLTRELSKIDEYYIIKHKLNKDFNNNGKAKYNNVEISEKYQLEKILKEIDYKITNERYKERVHKLIEEQSSFLNEKTAEVFELFITIIASRSTNFNYLSEVLKGLEYFFCIKSSNTNYGSYLFNAILEILNKQERSDLENICNGLDRSFFENIFDSITLKKKFFSELTSGDNITKEIKESKHEHNNY